MDELNPFNVKFKKEVVKRRVVDYYILATIAFLVFIILTIGPISDYIDGVVNKKWQGVMLKALVLFIVIYTIDVYMTKNWQKFCDDSHKYKSSVIIPTKELV